MPLAPRTLSEYRAALKRIGGHAPAFGSLDAGRLPQVIQPVVWQHLANSGRLVLRAAIRWAYTEAGQEALGKEIAGQIELKKEIRRVKKNPTRADVDLFIAAAKNIAAPWRELLLIGVAMGFRREELLLLERSAIEKAIKGEKILRFVRKGMIEGDLPITHCEAQFKALLRQPATLGRGAALDQHADEWLHVWEIVGTSYRAAYERLKRIVKKTAKDAGCSSEWTPHSMRHAFASEMARDGAEVYAIAAALNHSSWQTSQRYVHIDAADLQKWMKPRGDGEDK
jgi:site-specific recombinase XerD